MYRLLSLKLKKCLLWQNTQRTAIAIETENDFSNPKSTPVPSQSISFPESNILLITDHKLTVHNFNQWCCPVMTSRKGKEEYQNKMAEQSEENSPVIVPGDNMVISWLLNSKTLEIGKFHDYEGDLECSLRNLFQ